MSLRLWKTMIQWLQMLLQTSHVQYVECHQLNLNCNDMALVSSVLLNLRDCRAILLRRIFINENL